MIEQERRNAHSYSTYASARDQCAHQRQILEHDQRHAEQHQHGSDDGERRHTLAQHHRAENSATTGFTSAYVVTFGAGTRVSSHR